MAKRQQACDFMKENPIGTKIGFWEIVDMPVFVMSGSHRKSKILCKCKCNKEKMVSLHDLKVGKTVQCKNCARKVIHKDRPDIILEEDYAIIPLQGKHQYKTLIIDIIDIDRVKEHLWYGFTSSRGVSVYARTNINKEKWNITQFIMNDKINVYDHIDGNPMNNRRSNLRICNSVQNSRNKNKSTKRKFSSDYIGVCKHKSGWVAYISKEDKKHWTKLFKTEIEAALARDKRAKEVYGEFAKLNFPEGETQVAEVH